MAPFDKHLCFQRTNYPEKCGGSLSLLEFRMKLISSMIELYGNDNKRYRKGGRPSLTENPFRLIERHFPTYVPATDKKMNAQRRCVVCKKGGVRKDTRYQCLRCDVGL